MIFLWGPIGLAAMLVLGSPLLFLSIRYQWAGFLAYMAAGAFVPGSFPAPFCAMSTSSVSQDSALLTGVVSGLVLRLILFGYRAIARAWRTDSNWELYARPKPITDAHYFGGGWLWLPLGPDKSFILQIQSPKLSRKQLPVALGLS
jgi:hypothetical protein